MKKNIKYIVSALLIAAAAFSFSACKKQNEPAAASVSASSSEAEKSAESSAPEEEEPSADTSSAEEQTLSFNIGNDIGRNVSSLMIKPDGNSTWTEISLDNVWASGYMIPVTLSSEEIPTGADWEVKIVFEDDKTEKTFENVKIEEGANIILTEDEVVYS